jgi:predicted secreted protein
MATVGIVNGHYLRFFDGGVAIAKATECTISWAVEMRETAHKDTAGDGGGWKEVAPGQKSGTGSTSGLYAEDTNSFATLYGKMAAGTAITGTFTTGESGDSVWYFTGYITSMELNAPNNENVTYSISFEFSGEVTLS